MRTPAILATTVLTLALAAPVVAAAEAFDP